MAAIALDHQKRLCWAPTPGPHQKGRKVKEGLWFRYPVPPTGSGANPRNPGGPGNEGNRGTVFRTVRPPASPAFVGRLPRPRGGRRGGGGGGSAGRHGTFLGPQKRSSAPGFCLPKLLSHRAGMLGTSEKIGRGSGGARGHRRRRKQKPYGPVHDRVPASAIPGRGPNGPGMLDLLFPCLLCPGHDGPWNGYNLVPGHRASGRDKPWPAS